LFIFYKTRKEATIAKITTHKGKQHGYYQQIWVWVVRYDKLKAEKEQPTC